jgi:TPR repeat protein
MDSLTAQRLREETEILLKSEDWSSVDAVWRPQVLQGDVEAQFQLAYYYLFCGFEETPQIREEMENLLRAAAERDYPDAVYWLTHLCPDGEESDALLLKAGLLGCPEAQRALGACYATGDWTGGCDTIQAAEWYWRAADRGDAEAQYNLGFMYLLGQGVASNSTEGLRLLRLAADQGDAGALHLLADLYENGYYGVPADPSEASRWNELYRRTAPYLRLITGK